MRARAPYARSHRARRVARASIAGRSFLLTCGIPLIPPPLSRLPCILRTPGRAGFRKDRARVQRFLLARALRRPRRGVRECRRRKNGYVSTSRLNFESMSAFHFLKKQVIISSSYNFFNEWPRRATRGFQIRSRFGE